MVELDPEQLPNHVAIIMDGNGRWAEQRGLPRLHGHRVGKDSVRAVVETARRVGVKYLSLYAFSTENWQRPPKEVEGLMGLLRRYLASELGKMMRNQIRLLVAGNVRKLPAAVRDTLRATIHATRNNTGMTVVLAVSYSGREELARAMRRVGRLIQKGTVDPNTITPALIHAHLDNPEVPDPDLLIRTSGEMRVSNFFLWQLAYTELMVTDTLWPDFRERDFVQAIASYQERERRFGRTAGQLDRERLRAAN